MDNTNVSNDYYEEFGVPGLICRSKSNPKEYVFFPISGYINPASTSDTHGGIWAWTSTPYSEQAYAFYYNGVYYPNQHVYRYYGLPVRGVHT